MMLYNKYVGSSFSYSGILRYVGYFNDKKMRYYFVSLQEKGIEALSHLQVSYDMALYKFTQDNNIDI